MTRASISLCAGLAVLACALAWACPPTTTVAKLDPVKYAGRWFEVARKPFDFEGDSSGKPQVCVTADYAVLPNGHVQVVNSGRPGQVSAVPRVAKADAIIPDPKQPGQLKIAFFMPFNSTIFYIGDYKVIALADDYSYAAVTGCSTFFGVDKQWLWILSRKPTLDASVLSSLLKIATSQSIDVSDVKMTVQAGCWK
jgi:apolipoprotein D and lipocalin family protein